jgi:hypothetical protein
MTQQRTVGHTGGGLYYFLALIYVGLVALFAWQTSIFVNWLFPNDQIMMKILTVLCFDGMDFLWGALDLFYRFASRNTRHIVRWGWGISFLLSLLASILYLVISSMFRFDLTLGAVWVNVGYGVVIVAVVFQIVMVTFFLYLEWLLRHPYQDEYLESLSLNQMKTLANKIQMPVTGVMAMEEKLQLASPEKKKRPRKLPDKSQDASMTQKE